MNVTQRADWDNALQRTLKEFGQIDILINNAGTSYKNKPTLDVTEAEYARCFDVNCLGIFHSVSTVFPVFVKQKAGICINMSSCGASRPRQGLVWYNASKGAVSNVRLADYILFKTSIRQSISNVPRQPRDWLWNLVPIKFESTQSAPFFVELDCEYKCLYKNSLRSH